MKDPASIKPYPLLADGFMTSCSPYAHHNALHIAGSFYTYEQLLEKAEIIFSQLPPQLPAYVGIYIEESIWTYAAIIAVSLGGACYVPLNPKLPEKKMQEMIAACDLQLIISEQGLSFTSPQNTLVINTQSAEKKSCRQLIHQPMAYLLFTSGTTGKPKGVPVSKKNTAAFFDHFHRHYQFNANDKFLQPYELSFDVSVFSIFAAWNVGACVYCVPGEGFKYLNIASVIVEHQITVSSMVPTVLLYLQKYLPGLSFPSLRYSFFSGDKLYQHLASQWQEVAPNAEIYNCYGPTETTIVCTAYRWREKAAIEESVNNIVPLGKAFDNLNYLLIDENNQVADSIGELCFSGGQVVEAYLNNSYADRFFTHNGKRYYKTGDLAEVNANGNLIFRGRVDAQVKINGYRVELAETEENIYKLTQKNAVVIATEQNNLNVLTAFIEGEATDAAALRQELSALLPDYMIPARFKFLSFIPKNINGKADLEQLKTMANE